MKNMRMVNAAQSNLPEKMVTRNNKNLKQMLLLKILSYCVFMTRLLFGDGLSLTQKKAEASVSVSLNK